MSLPLRQALAQVFSEVVVAHSRGQAHDLDAASIATHLSQVGLDQMCHELEHRHGVPARDAATVAFGVVDADGDGYISSAELADFLSHVENTLDEVAVAELMAEADRDGDGMISQQEFFELLLGGGGSPSVGTGASYSDEENDEGEAAAAIVPVPPSRLAVVPVGDLHGACLRGDEAAVDRMLREGADLLARVAEGAGDNAGGATALHCACEHGHPEVVRMLLLAAPYSSVLLEAQAVRRLARAKQSYSEATGPSETPRELAARIGHDNARRAMGEDIHRKWREVLLVIDQFVEEERGKAEQMLGQGMTRLSEGDVEGCLECAKTGLMLDRQNSDLQSLRDMAITMLSDEIEALLDQGDADKALDFASRRRDASPDIVVFSSLHVRGKYIHSRPLLVLAIVDSDRSLAFHGSIPRDVL